MLKSIYRHSGAGPLNCSKINNSINFRKINNIRNFQDISKISIISNLLSLYIIYDYRNNDICIYVSIRDML